MTQNKKLFLLTFLAALILLPLFTGCGGENDPSQTAGDDTGSGSSSIVAYGTVVSARRMVFHMPWDGRLTDVPVWEGASVVRGEVLAVFDPADRDAALEGAGLALIEAESRFDEAGSRQAAMEVSLTEAADRLERTRRLVSGGSVSAQELLDLQAEYDSLAHERAAAAAVAAVARAQADLAAERHRRLLERVEEEHFDGNRLVCPFDRAVVAELAIRSGAVFEEGTLLMALHDSDALVVEADLPEEFVRDVSVGELAEVIPVADPDLRLPGRVEALAGMARLVNGENVVKIRVSFEDPDVFLREGFNVDVEIAETGTPSRD